MVCAGDEDYPVPGETETVMKKEAIGWAIIAALLLQGCSSRPREFTPSVSGQLSDTSDFNVAYGACQQLLTLGKLDASGRLASGAAGVAAGATTVALGSAAATSAGLYGGGVALASATVVLLPFAVIGGAIGMAKMRRHRKEIGVQRAMSGCLAERGYSVSGWTKAAKHKATAPSAN